MNFTSWLIQWQGFVMTVMDIEFVDVVVKEDPGCRVVCLITLLFLYLAVCHVGQYFQDSVSTGIDFSLSPNL